jgi:hypothetical protein
MIKTTDIIKITNMIRIQDIIKSISLIITIYNLDVLLLKNIGFRISQNNSYLLSNVIFQVMFFYSLVYNLSKNIYITAFIATSHFLIKFYLTPKKIKTIKIKKPQPTRKISNNRTLPTRTKTTTTPTTPTSTTTPTANEIILNYDDDDETNYININEIPKKLLEITLLILLSVTFTTNIYIVVILVIIFMLNNYI